MKFHRRRIERLTNKFRKLNQAKPRTSNSVSKQQPSNSGKHPPTPSEKIVQNENVNDLATVILAKIGDTLLERLRSKSKNKESEVYPVVLSDPLAIGEEGIENQHNNKKRKDRRKDQHKKRHLATQRTYQKPAKHTIDRRANQFTISWFKIHSSACNERKCH